MEKYKYFFSIYSLKFYYFKGHQTESSRLDFQYLYIALKENIFKYYIEYFSEPLVTTVQGKKNSLDFFGCEFKL